ncbi:uncharacterized protein HMPREF1541_08728 [Cyphellophora europaea CBS 101466]|uniref:Uncharacterized protein n=1 Tax=Cyphellophora europaea (strain CBS 101466) TaxID=1220924 RepID=W2RJE7_CYPE1|nr:uncharacterized protein HMPREF1541_08728 [Cyphellophora europaea CBS 101466]ETN36450.1 hypothetical protein HMPREF1541_08728 [Cyphellophora europaea CBS 101466]
MFGTRRSPRTHAAPRSTRHTTTTTKPGIMSRLTGGGRTRKTHTTTTTTAPRTQRKSGWGTRRRAPRAAPVATHHRRKPSMGDKVAGALKKVQGSLTRNPAKKAAGTRRMHGTDGRGSRRVY